MIDPVALQIGPLAIRWYGISYAVGLAFVIWFMMRHNQKTKTFRSNDQIFDLCFWIFLLGVIVGGRLGYVLFYNLPYYLENPLKALAIWEGGMSFHGGFIGTVLVLWFYTKKHKLSRLKVMDALALPGALANTAGRLANFVNQELVGRPVKSPDWEWIGVDFGDGILRYPSQLFQAVGSVILFGMLYLLSTRKLQPGALMAGYLILQGALRFVAEFWRAPDPQIGFVLGKFTLGQLLSLAMVVTGFSVLGFIRGRAK